LRAGFTADTSAVVKINDSVRASVKRGYRTNLDTRRVGAVITAHHGKKPARVGKFALFDVFYPRSINADWNVVFGFAGDRASVTADTLAVIYYETIIHLIYKFE
jgi:hypothetical protein